MALPDGIDAFKQTFSFSGKRANEPLTECALVESKMMEYCAGNESPCKSCPGILEQLAKFFLLIT
jgi:hypothetical protein